MKIFTSVFLASLTLLLSLASPVFAIDATQAVRLNVTPKSPIPTGTVATWPLDASVPPGWLACNGQAVPSAYPELRALMGSVPNYNSQQFLRGSTSGAGRTVADSTRSHTHGQPSHSHGFSLTAAGQNIASATAAGQNYVDGHTGVNSRPQHYYPHPTSPSANPVIGGVWVSSGEATLGTIQSYLVYDASNRTAQSSRVTGYTSSSSVSGNIYQSGGDKTYATGGVETAPQHTLVKFIIKHD